MVFKKGDENFMRRPEQRERMKGNTNGFKKGYTPHNKNKTYEECYGVKGAEEVRRKFSKSYIGKKVHSEEFKLKSSERMKSNNPMKNKEIAKKVGESHKGKLTGELNPAKRPEIRKKISASKQGIPLEKWEKFTHFEPYGEEFNNNFKNSIRKRDNQICMNCGIHREKIRRALNIHHINYNKELNCFENCISLCDNCHSLTNSNREYWTKHLQLLLSKRYGYNYSENGEVILNLKQDEENVIKKI